MITASASANISAASAPRGGYITVNANSGTTFLSLFRFEAVGWESIGSTLAYRFVEFCSNSLQRFSSVDSTGVRRILRSALESALFECSFSTSGSITVVVTALNSFGVEASSNVTILVQDAVVENVTNVLQSLKESIE